jgi:hypothetical protein
MNITALEKINDNTLPKNGVASPPASLWQIGFISSYSNNVQAINSTSSSTSQYKEYTDMN